MGAETTFSVDLTEFDDLAAELEPLIDKVWRHCEDTGGRGRTVTLKVKFADFEIMTRSRSVATPVSNREDLKHLSVALLRNELPLPNWYGCWAFHCRLCRTRSRPSLNWACRFKAAATCVACAAVSGAWLCGE